MLEKNPEGLINDLSGIIGKGAILQEGTEAKQPRDIVIKIPDIVFLGKDRNGPFVSAHESDITKVHPKKYGFGVKKIGNEIIFQ